MGKSTNIQTQLATAKRDGKKKFAVLIDPDKLNISKVDEIVLLAQEVKIDYFFIGGSLVVNDVLDEVIKTLKASTSVPVILFPGSSRQLSFKADGILFLSLISGRNAELLIGKHVETAPFLKMSPLEVLPTGYMLIDGGVSTSVSYMSNTSPIPADKVPIALCTAMAGEMLGLRVIYMDAGSGALNPVSDEMIKAVSNQLDIPLIVGGGIKDAATAFAKLKAGADIIVVGNAIEKDPTLIKEISEAVHSLQPEANA